MASIDDRLDRIDLKLAHIQGQFDVVSPKDMAKLQADVASIKAHNAGISTFISAFVAGLVSFFFRGTGA